MAGRRSTLGTVSVEAALMALTVTGTDDAAEAWMVWVVRGGAMPRLRMAAAMDVGWPQGPVPF